MSLNEIKEQRDRLLASYADQMDHVAKYARAECKSVRDGSWPDVYAGQVLTNALRAYEALVAFDEAPSPRSRAMS